MDENTLQQIAQFFSKWGFAQALAIILIMTITWFVKLPIYHAGQKYAEKYGVNKAAITWIIGLIPFVLGFVAALVIALWGDGWSFERIDWSAVVKQCFTLATASMGTYEFVKKLFEAEEAAKEKSQATAAAEEAAKNADSGAKAEVTPVAVKAKVLEAKAEGAKEAAKTKPTV